MEALSLMREFLFWGLGGLVGVGLTWQQVRMFLAARRDRSALEARLRALHRNQEEFLATGEYTTIVAREERR